MADIDLFERAGPSTTTPWIHTLKGHLNDGGSSFARDQRGSAARVSGQVGFKQARAVGSGMFLAVTIQQPDTLITPFETAIRVFGGVFITRGQPRDAIPTAFQYSLVPIGGFSLAEPQQPTVGPAPPALRNGGGLLASVTYFPVVLSNVCILLYNFSWNLSFSAGH